MINKKISIEKAINKIADQASIMVGGFGVPGTPFLLIDELVRQGQKGLTLIKNDANEANLGIDRLLANGQVERLIVSHIGLNPNANKMMNNGELQVEFCAQGILAERIRAAGAGLKGILTDIGIETLLAEDKAMIEINEKKCLIETPLSADFALIHAGRADHFGNLRYQASARNFNPLMAMAARCVIVETEELLPLGEIAPDDAHTSGVFVDHIVHLTQLSESYNVIRR